MAHKKKLSSVERRIKKSVSSCAYGGNKSK